MSHYKFVMAPHFESISSMASKYLFVGTIVNMMNDEWQF